MALKEQLVPKVENIARLSDLFKIEFRSKSTSLNSGVTDGSISLTWQDIFKIVGPSFFKPSPPTMIKSSIIGALYDLRRNLYEFTLFSTVEDVIKIQLVAYGFIKIFEAEAVGGAVSEFLQLTDLGKPALIEIAAVRADAGV